MEEVEQAVVPEVGPVEAEPVEAPVAVEPEPVEEEEETVITLAGESPTPEEKEQENELGWVRNLRKQNREQQKENRQLRAELEAVKKARTTETKPVELGPVPRLSDDDIDFDEDKLRDKLIAYHQRKQEIESAEAREQEAQKQQQREWDEKLKGYQEKKSALKIKDFEEAEETALSALNQIQQSIIVDSAKDPAVLMYAIGKNPEKAKELAAIANPLKFARAIWELEGGLTVTTTRKPKPEATVRGTAPMHAGTTSLDRLREKAQKTYDWDGYFEAKRKLKK